MKRLLRHHRTLSIGARLLGAYLRFALRTTSWSLDGADHLGEHLLGRPAIFAFWHECLPLMPALWLRAQRERAASGGPAGGRMHVLASRHGDGRLIGGIMRGFGVEVVHGSSARGKAQRGGAAGLRALAAALRDGGQVVITPDGPRGPPRRAAAGVAQLAALAGAPIVPCAARTSRCRRLPTWDRMLLPFPFGRGVLVCGAPVTVPRGPWAGQLATVEAALTAAADRAEAVCPA